MNKRAILGVLLAMVLPFTGYFLVKYYSEAAVDMPHRYFYDSVATVNNNGKISVDTIWHKAKNLSFTNQLGKTVDLDSLKGKILVIDFFFSRCPSICPGLAKSMQRLQNSFGDGKDSIVQFISISIDPEYDSVPQLRKFANRYTSNHDSWWFLTGNKKEIYDFAFNELKASIADTEVDTAFIHTENFFLLDRDRVVRGWYNGFDTVKQAKLVRDIPLLMLEKNKKRTFKDFLKELFERS
ncbi:SCO family protein [Ferruginibacter lapsinanis]|uniref:SCO family protein n=1 Tax=Ferruginibacter lapsinanis TaxID=563172 RepID=UPI001E32FD02|nr:SCO family protein [Ferruginibacter lapsinanis]UEG50690.1 SCO family protein [Ferruginibacter lapsinanis]